MNDPAPKEQGWGGAGRGWVWGRDGEGWVGGGRLIGPRPSLCTSGTVWHFNIQSASKEKKAGDMEIIKLLGASGLRAVVQTRGHKKRDETKHGDTKKG